MKIGIIGTGYVGLVSGACLAEVGHTVYCIDNNAEKISKLNQGIVPIFEPGLDDLVYKNTRNGRLYFLNNLLSVIQNIEVLFLAVGTPPKADYSADLSAITEASKEIGQLVKKHVLVVTKSTVPVGTSDLVKKTIADNLEDKNIAFDVASNPEFLREGAAIKDFLEPDRIVVGVENKKTEELLREVYYPFIQQGSPFVVTDIRSAEVIKYASNSFLATKISFINEIANFCEKVGANIDKVAYGMGFDSRIGKKYLQAGIGYGGSCFPKDVKALIATGISHDINLHILEAVERINNQQYLKVIEKIERHISPVKGKKIAIWGLAFKAKTDDIRESPALKIISRLESLGATVCAYDPIVKQCDGVSIALDMYDCLEDADALAVITDWEDFFYPNFPLMKKKMKNHLIIDGRNMYDPTKITSENFAYEGIGRAL